MAIAILKYAEDVSWEHEEITLMPLNPSFQPIVIPSAEEEEFIVVAEFVGFVSH